MNSPVNELIEFVSEPKKKEKKPSNWALYAALIFANCILLVIDGISGFTVYLMTAWWGYGLLTVLAGFVPLVLHEGAYVRAFSSKWQKIIAVAGAVLAIGSVVLIGALAAIVNVMGISVQVQTAEIVTVVSLVGIAAAHALLFIVFFYIDDGINANQRTEQAIANSIHKTKMISAGGRVLHTAQNALVFKKAIEQQHGPQGAEALAVILSQLLEDKNGDGIPDILQKRQQPPNHQYNQTVPFGKNGNGSSEDGPNS